MLSKCYTCVKQSLNNVEMREKVLIIGTYSAEGVDSFDWWQELPNIAECDTVILDTTKILSFWSMAGRVEQLEKNIYLLSDVSETDERMRSNLGLVKRKLMEILEFPVSVYVLYCPEILICQGPVYSNSPYGKRFMHTNDWCPLSIDTFAEKGEIIYVKDKSYEDYFRDFKGWEYYFTPDSLQIGELEEYYRHEWKVIPKLRAIATNKVEKPLAVEFIPYFHPWVDEQHVSWKVLSEITGGSLVLLPTADRYETAPLIEILLQRGKEFEETPQPTWVDDIEIPGEANLKLEIAAEKEKLKEVEASVTEKEASLHELRKHKRLLYDTGISLQDTCRLTFEELGAKTKPSEVTDEFIVEIDGKEALVEVKGNEKSIHKRDISQLITDRGQHLATTGQYIKGILVGNAWRHSRINERDTRDRPIFTDKVVEIAEDQNIGLISTTELFEAYRKTLEEPQHKQEILNKIISGKGVIKL